MNLIEAVIRLRNDNFPLSYRYYDFPSQRPTFPAKLSPWQMDFLFKTSAGKIRRTSWRAHFLMEIYHGAVVFNQLNWANLIYSRVSSNLDVRKAVSRAQRRQAPLSLSSGFVWSLLWLAPMTHSIKERVREPGERVVQSLITICQELFEFWCCHAEAPKFVFCVVCLLISSASGRSGEGCKFIPKRWSRSNT